MRCKDVLDRIDHRKEQFASRARRCVPLSRCERVIYMTVRVVSWAALASSCCELASATDFRISQPSQGVGLMGRRPGKVFEASLTVRRRLMPSNSPPEHAFLCTADCSHLRLLPVPCVFSSTGGRRSAWRRHRGDGRRRSRYGARAEPSGPRAEYFDRASESFFCRAQRCVVDACERIYVYFRRVCVPCMPV